MSEERLQKVLARVGIASRRQVEGLIREGRITINGRVAGLGDKADLERDAVKVDGKRVGPPTAERRYVILYKPDGYVSTTRDPEGRPSVLDILPHSMRHNMKPVGRLDFHSEGLLILTDDGDFAQRIAHPRFGCGKTYEVKVKGRPDDRTVEKLRRGLVIDRRRVVPGAVEPLAGRLGPRQSIDNSWWRVVLFEGRNRQIREMFFRVGHPVSRLRRVAIGPISDPHLGPGVWRELTEQEREKLLKAARSRPSVRPINEVRAGGGKPTGKDASEVQPRGLRSKGRPSPGGTSKGRPTKRGPRRRRR